MNFIYINIKHLIFFQMDNQLSPWHLLNNLILSPLICSTIYYTPDSRMSIHIHRSVFWFYLGIYSCGWTVLF